MGEGCRSRVLTFEEHAAAAAPGHTAGRRVPEIEARGRLCAAERARALRGDVPELWDEAARAWEGLGRPYPAAYARWREAVAAMAAGDREAAARALARARAREGVDRLEAEPLRAVVAALAAEVGPVASVTASCPDPDRAASQTGRSSDPVSRSAEPPPADSHGLTPRELDVLRLSLKATATGRSARSSSSPRAPRPSTSTASRPSSASPAGPRRSRSRTAPDLSKSPATRPGRRARAPAHRAELEGPWLGRHC